MLPQYLYLEWGKDMPVSLKESQVAAEMAKLLYAFLPGSGSSQWKGHVTFGTVAQHVGVGNFWQGGSKEPAIAALLESTLLSRRDLFEPLVVGIVREGIRYRQTKGNPVKKEEIETLNGLILQIGFKFPALWDAQFLASLDSGALDRAKASVEEAKAAERIKTEEQSARSKKLNELRERYYQLARQTNRQAAGIALESVLNELFDLFDAAPRKRFRVVGEEIDGSFELDHEIYLLEAKWETEPLSEAPLLGFRGKIEGKSTFTRGLLVSINGFSQPALEAITRGKQPNFFMMDGYDLTLVIEGQMRLDELLRGKIRRLSEEGTPFVSAKEFL
ncbi:MAG: hypothetical protein AB1473_01780 [Thermodesulfobacteriota bacterium]